MVIPPLLLLIRRKIIRRFLKAGAIDYQHAVTPKTYVYADLRT